MFAFSSEETEMLYATQHVKTIFCNGLANTYEDARTGAQAISQILGRPVDFCYNNGPNDLLFGTTSALAGASLSLLTANSLPLVLVGAGSKTLIEKRKAHCAERMVEQIRLSLREHPFNRVVLILHSQGRGIGEKALNQLALQEKRRITVVTLGSSPITEQSAAKVINLRQKGDLVPTFMGIRDDIAYWLNFNFYPPKKRSYLINGNAHSLSSYLHHPGVQSHLIHEYARCTDDVAQQAIAAGYAGRPIPSLEKRFYHPVA